MARNRMARGNPVARGALGTSMMSRVADLAQPPPATDEGAEPGSDLQTELRKIDRAALSGGERSAVTQQSIPLITIGAAAIVLAAMYKAVRGRRRRFR
jgi:hypothetical protein